MAYWHHKVSYLDQNLLRLWNIDWWYQAITFANIDLSSKVFCGIHLTEISKEVLMNLIRNMRSEFTLLKLLPSSWGQWAKQLNMQIVNSLRSSDAYIHQ